MDILLLALLGAMAFAVGILTGAGNYGGVRGAILPGLVFGLLFSVHSLRDGDYAVAAFTVLCALAGAIACTRIPENGALKTFMRQQKSLVIRLGSYRLGGDNPRPPVGGSRGKRLDSRKK